MNNIPLRWIRNTLEDAKTAFGGGRSTPELTYLGAPIVADFELTYQNLVPYVTAVLDLAAPLEGAGLSVKLVEIKNGQVKVWQSRRSTATTGATSRSSGIGVLPEKSSVGGQQAGVPAFAGVGALHAIRRDVTRALDPAGSSHLDWRTLVDAALADGSDGPAEPPVDGGAR